VTAYVVDANDSESLQKIASKICAEVGTLCLDGSTDTRKLANFALIYLETFVMLGDKAIECAKHHSCVSQALKIIGEVFQLAVRGEYIYSIEPGLYIEMARKLKELD